MENIEGLKRREDLPSFLKLDYKFNVKEILNCFEKVGMDFNCLNNINDYGKVAKCCSRHQKTFGIQFDSIEEAYNFLDKSNQIPKGMNWDYRKFVKQTEEGFELVNTPYKQMPLTGLNKDLDLENIRPKIPSYRMDERKYNKVKDWVKGTYLEDVINTFKGNVTRVRLARMEPGCLIDEHIDYNTDYSIRFHIPLITNEKSAFKIKRKNEDEGEVFHMPADGGVWFLNQGFKHSAWNYGDTVRDHLVLSVYGQDDIM